MSVFVSFMRDNWKIIVVCVIGLTNFVLLLCKKTKIVNKVFNTPMTQVLRTLPAMILETENMGWQSGSDKLSFVVQNMCALYSELTGEAYSDVFNKYRYVFERCVEDILATPQKKGEK